MRRGMYNFQGAQDEITLAHIVTMMNSIPAEDPQFLMSQEANNPYQLWTKGAYIKMGFRMNGDAVPSGDAATLTNANAGVGGVVDINDPVNGVLHRWWNAISPWTVIWPHESNTTTNAAVSIFDIQLYVLLESTGQWTRIDGRNGSQRYAQTYYATDTHAWQQAGAFLHDPVNFRLANALVRNAGDRGAPSALESKFSYLHNTLTGWIEVDGSDVIGVFSTFKARMFSTDGAAYNGVTNVRIDAGVDFQPELTSALNTGELAGLTYYPGSGGSDWIQLPTDGSVQRVSYCTVGGSGFDTLLDNANDGTWSATNNPYLSYSEIAAKLPVLRFNSAV